MSFFLAGNVYCLGRKEYGRLGLGEENLEEKSAPTLVASLSGKKCVSANCGAAVSYAVVEDGSSAFLFHVKINLHEIKTVNFYSTLCFILYGQQSEIEFRRFSQPWLNLGSFFVNYIITALIEVLSEIKNIPMAAVLLSIFCQVVE